MVVLPGSVSREADDPGVKVEAGQDERPGEDKVGLFYNIRLGDAEVKKEVAIILRNLAENLWDEGQ